MHDHHDITPPAQPALTPCVRQPVVPACHFPHDPLLAALSGAALLFCK